MFWEARVGFEDGAIVTAELADEVGEAVFGEAGDFDAGGGHGGVSGGGGGIGGEGVGDGVRDRVFVGEVVIERSERGGVGFGSGGVGRVEVGGCGVTGAGSCWS